MVCHSSGNHAQAVALAAKNRKIPAHVVMPRAVASIKKKAVIEYGAHVIECDSLMEERVRLVRYNLFFFFFEKEPYLILPKKKKLVG